MFDIFFLKILRYKVIISSIHFPRIQISASKKFLSKMNKLNDLLELLKSVLRALLNPIGSSSILKIVFYNIAPTPSKYIYTFL